MKLLTLILGIYMLVLPCMPCMDSDACNEPATIPVVQSAGQHDHGNEEEACAPFCNCTCCGHIVTPNSQALKMVTVKPVAANRLPSYYNSIFFPSDFFGNIWQPPRIA